MGNSFVIVANTCEILVDIVYFSFIASSRTYLCPTHAFSVKRCILSPYLKVPCGCSTRGKYFYVTTAWMSYNCGYHVLFFHCTVRVQLCPKFAFLFNSCILSLSLKCPRGCTTREKYFYVKSVLKWDCVRHHLVFFHCIVSRLAIYHNRILSQLVRTFHLSKMFLQVHQV